MSDSKKHNYKATFKDWKGQELAVTRTSTHDYKYAWLVQVRVYGWRMQNGERVEYDHISTDFGFSAHINAASDHGYKDFDVVGHKDWKGMPYEQHNRVLLKAVAPVELVK